MMRHGDAEFVVGLIQQSHHVQIALTAIGGTEHDADQADIAAHGGAGEVVAGGFDIAGLQPIRAGIAFQQMVVIEDGAAVEAEARHREIPVFLREVLDQMAGEQRQVPGSGDLCRVWQAGGIAEGGAAHAQSAGAEGHGLSEARFLATEQFAQRAGGIVGGFGHQAKDGFLDGDFGAGDESKFGRRLGGGVGGDRDELVERDTTVAQGFERHI